MEIDEVKVHTYRQQEAAAPFKEQECDSSGITKPEIVSVRKSVKSKLNSK